jgi:hypothetical protein
MPTNQGLVLRKLNWKIKIIESMTVDFKSYPLFKLSMGYMVFRSFVASMPSSGRWNKL